MGWKAPSKSFDFTRVVRFHSGISGGSACFSQKNPKLPLGVEELFAYIAMFSTPSPGKADLFANVAKITRNLIDLLRYIAYIKATGYAKR